MLFSFLLKKKIFPKIILILNFFWKKFDKKKKSKEDVFCLSTFIQLKSEDCDATGFILYTILICPSHTHFYYTHIKTKKSKQQKKNSRLVKIPKLFSLKQKKNNKTKIARQSSNSSNSRWQFGGWNLNELNFIKTNWNNSKKKRKYYHQKFWTKYNKKKVYVWFNTFLTKKN